MQRLSKNADSGLPGHQAKASESADQLFHQMKLSYLNRTLTDQMVPLNETKFNYMKFFD